MKLTQDIDAPLVDGDSMCTATVLHGGPGLPLIPGYVIALHSTQLALPIIPPHSVQVGVDTHQPCRDTNKMYKGLKRS